MFGSVSCSGGVLGSISLVSCLYLCDHHPNQDRKYLHHPRNFHFQLIFLLPIQATTFWFYHDWLIWPTLRCHVNGIHCISLWHLVHFTGHCVFLNLSVSLHLWVDGSFYWRVVFHCMDVLQFAYLFCYWTSGYSQFGLLLLIEFFCGHLFPLGAKLLGHRVYTALHSHLSIRDL